jgi:hypothetical protein
MFVVEIGEGDENMHKKRILQSQHECALAVNLPRSLGADGENCSFPKPLQRFESKVIKNNFAHATLHRLHDRDFEARIDGPKRPVYDREDRS